MCIAFVSFHESPELPLIVASNRDERDSRPSAPASFWDDESGILAGRDLQAGGTWLGVTRSGRFGVVTNFRDPKDIRADAPSRGEWVTRFLRSDLSPRRFLDQCEKDADRYNGFNLLLSDGEELCFFSNRGIRRLNLPPGHYGVSNGPWGSDWPKVKRGLEIFSDRLKERAAPEDLLELLEDRTIASDSMLPDTGIGLIRERALSPIFIDTPDYGTRASTVVLFHRNGRQNGRNDEIELIERTHRRKAMANEIAERDVRFRFSRIVSLA